MLSKQSLKEILELVNESEGSFVILEKDQPRLATLDFHNYEQLVQKATRLASSSQTVSAEASFSKQKVLLTGGSSRFGSLVAEKLREKDYDVVIFDTRAPQESQLGFFEGSLTNPEDLQKVFSENSFDSVVHLAQLSENGHSAQEYFEVNVQGGINLLQQMSEHGVTQLVYYSSVLSDSAYCRTKTLFEKILNFYYHGFGIKSFSLRMPGLCKSQAVDGQAVEALLLEDPVQAVLLTAKGRFGTLPVPNLGDLTADGSPLVEYISEGDAARAVLFALRHLQQNEGSFVYRVDGIKTSIKNLIEETLEKTHRMVPISYAKPSPFWTDNTQDTTKPLSNLGWKPVVSTVEASIENAWQKMQEEVGREPMAANNEQDVQEPVSLSDLLSGKYTPFIKSHS